MKIQKENKSLNESIEDSMKDNNANMHRVKADAVVNPVYKSAIEDDEKASKSFAQVMRDRKKAAQSAKVDNKFANHNDVVKPATKKRNYAENKNRRFTRNSLNEDREYDLIPSNRKSFYGKAKVVDKGNNEYELRSYNTIVSRAKDGKVTHLGKYSPTTSRHQKEFERQFSESLMNEGWRGCDNIKMVSHGSWGDPDLVYDGYTFNYWDIEDALWFEFLEETGYDDSMSDDPKVEAEFDKYCQENAEGYLEDVIAGGYFEDDSTSWHDRYNEAYSRKTRDVYCILTNYGYGWECESEYTADDYDNPRKAAYEDAKEYRRAGANVRVVLKRERIPQPTNEGCGRKLKKKSKKMTEGFRDNRDIIWESDSFVDWIFNGDIEEVKEYLENNREYMNIDDEEELSDSEIRDLVYDDYVSSDINYDYEDLVETVIPEIAKQCYGDMIWFVGNYQRWDGGHDAIGYFDDVENGIKSVCYPNYDSTAVLSRDENGNVVFSESSHDAPMGGTSMTLYSFKDKQSYDAADEDNEDGAEGIYYDSEDPKTVHMWIEKGYLTPIKL